MSHREFYNQHLVSSKMNTVFLNIFVLLASLFISSASHLNICNDNCARCEEGRCRECLYGWYGHNCNSSCHNCWTSGCHKHSGKCEQCTPGKYMEDCGTDCPDNCKPDKMKAVSCRRQDGKCQDGCKEGWWGDTCNRLCSQQCEGRTCLQDNGNCIGDCNTGWWGPHCTKECSAGCIGEKCNWWSGKCIDGCKPSLYGKYCSQGCSSNCKEKTCNRHGVCKRGCIDGFRGKRCDERCQLNCLTCDKGSDICTKCNPGWNGVLCEQNITMHVYSRYEKKAAVSLAEMERNGGGGQRCSYTWLLSIVFSLYFLVSLEMDTGC